MGLGAEARPAGQPGYGVRQTLLDPAGGIEVLDGPAAQADEMVMVTARELLGQLETRVVISADDGADHPRLLQLRQVAVGGALRQPRLGGDQLGRGHRTHRPGQGLYEHPPPRGVTLPDSPQASCDLGVQVVDHTPSIYPVSHLQWESFSL